MIILLFACSKPPLVGEQKKRQKDASEEISLANCGGCHVEEMTEWRDSRHAQSWTNPIFQASFSVTSFPSWCQDCHQPILEKSLDTQFRDAGVGCLTCHWQEGEIRTSNPNTKMKSAPHKLRYDAQFGRSEFCAECHQFELPQYHPMHSDTPVQNTYQEWVESGSEKQCQNCHMKEYGHSFPGGHNQDFMKESIEVLVSRENEYLHVSLKSINVGHALPTGDPFRRLQWRLCGDKSCSHILVRKSFAIIHQGPSWHVEKDNRLHPKQEKHFSIPSPNTDTWWSLGYFFGDPYLEKHLTEEDIWMEISKGFISK